MQRVTDKWSSDRRIGALAPEAGMTIAATTLLSQLAPHPFAERWLARDTRTNRPMLAFRLTGSPGSLPLQAFLDAIHSIAHFRHRHSLPLQRCEAQHPTGKWIACPYHGGHSGIITLQDVLKQRTNGALTRTESFWLAFQLIDLCAAGEDRAMEPGTLTFDAIVIDRRNAPLVELFGLGPLLARLTMPARPLPSPRRTLESLATLLLRAATGIEAPTVGALTQTHRRAMHAGLRTWLTQILDDRSINTFTDARAALAQHGPSNLIIAHTPPTSQPPAIRIVEPRSPETAPAEPSTDLLPLC